MDVEETIKFILDAQAKAEVRNAQFEARMTASEAKFESRMSAADKRVDAMEKRLDKRMDGVNKLLQLGMKMLVKYQSETRTNINALVEAQMRSEARFEREMTELRAAQKDTQKTLKAFIESLQKGRNGH